MPPKKANTDGDINPFLDSVEALFAELSAIPTTSSRDFKFLRAQLITFLELCTKLGTTKAKARHSFMFANGTKPETELKKPPTWMRITTKERAVLEKTRKSKSLVKDLTDILKQQREEKKSLNTSFSDSSPSPEPKKRKRHRVVVDDEYAPPEPKKSKVKKTAQVAQPLTTRKIKAVRTPNGWSTSSTSGPRKNSSEGEKKQTTFDWNVVKKVNSGNKHKEAKNHAVVNHTSGPSSLDATQVADKEEEASALVNDDSPERQGSNTTRGAPNTQHVPPELKEQNHNSILNQCLELNPADRAVSAYHKQATGAVQEKILTDQQDSAVILDDTDIDTDADSEPDSQERVSSATLAATDSSNSAGFWPSAPKTSKASDNSVLHEYALPLRKKEKECDTTLQHLRTSLEIYESQIAHIPQETWKEYNTKIERFCQKPHFSELPFFDRFSKFRRIVYLEEEDAAMATNDWERLRKAAKLCGFLTEVTAPSREDAKSLVEREVSISLRDITWLEQTNSDKDHLWS